LILTLIFLLAFFETFFSKKEIERREGREGRHAKKRIEYLVSEEKMKKRSKKK